MDPSKFLLKHINPFSSQEKLEIVPFKYWVENVKFSLLRTELGKPSSIINNRISSWNVDLYSAIDRYNKTATNDGSEIFDIKKYNNSLQRNSVNEIEELNKTLIFIVKDYNEFVKKENEQSLKLQKLRTTNFNFKVQKNTDEFKNKSLFEQVIDAKNKLNSVSEREFRLIRDITNPFEKISNSIFSNRAAIKLANIDAVHELTYLHDKNYLRIKANLDTTTSLENRYNTTIFRDKNEVYTPLDEKMNYVDIPLTSDVADLKFGSGSKNKRFYFVDIAGAPGAMSQYCLWRQKNSFGYGISLKGGSGLDWRTDLLPVSESKLSRFRISYGKDGTGNLYNYENIEDFADSVRKDFCADSGIFNIEDKTKFGVNLAVADGGIPVDGNESQQERLTFRLLVAQVLTALKCLGNGGHFVLKLFDTVELGTVQLLQYLADCFDYINIIKPVSSRGANSEKYVVCYGFRKLIDNSQNTTVNNIINILSNFIINYNEDYSSLFPSELIDPSYKKYMVYTNDELLKNQLYYLDRINEYISTGKNKKVEKYVLSRSNKIWYLPEQSEALVKEENVILTRYNDFRRTFPYLGSITDSEAEKSRLYNSLLMTTVGRYSFTNTAHNDEIVKIIENKYINKAELKRLTIVDCTSCVGGDTIGFARYFKKVVSIEKDYTNFYALKNNVNAYGFDNIVVKNEDFMEIYKDIITKEKPDIIYMDPPWGGVGYHKEKVVDLYINGKDIKLIIDEIRAVDPNLLIVIKVPYNFNGSDLLQYFGRMAYISNISSGNKREKGNYYNDTVFSIITIGAIPYQR